jgi:membrane protease YdiL (CAAX protease family)
MQRSRMLQRLRPVVVAALADAARSTMTEDLGAARRWVSVAGFLALAALLVLVAMVGMAVALALAPGLGPEQVLQENLPDTPFRLWGEGRQVLFFGGLLGVLAFAILAAAALTWRRRLTDFLWPGRRVSLSQLWIGFVVMSCISVALIPVFLLTGSVWEPPILDPHYLDSSRVFYAAAMVVGLLAAAAAEEVVCRGVLLRLTAFVTRRPLILCLINGVVFSAIHLDPDPVAFVARAISGGVWTWAALRLGGLEFAVGAHLANNLVIALFWQPFSEAAMSRETALADLGPELAAAVVIVLFVERLAGRNLGPPASLAPRPA